MNNRCICNKHKDLTTTGLLIEAGMWTTLFMEEENNQYFLAAYGDDKVRARILHCPFCGRDLDN